MLAGVRVQELRRFADERGFFAEIMRGDWADLFGEERPVQANLSVTYPNAVRAWHRHERGQVDYFVVVRGGAKICAYDDKSRELDEFIATGENLAMLRVPGNYWHGFKAFGTEPTLLVYFVNKLYQEKDPDERRRPWNDPTLIPSKIDGKADDPRAGKPWDWLLSPNK